MSKSLLKPSQNQGTSYECVGYRIATNGKFSRVCIRDHNYSDARKKPWLSSKNDPLQDYIRRTLAGKVICRSNQSEPVVYSTLSKEKGDNLIRPVKKFSFITNETILRGHVITTPQVRATTTSYHPYLEQRRAKYLIINRNGINGIGSGKEDFQKLYSKESTSKTCNVTDRLDFIEKYIARNANQFGYVALNDTILMELGNAIIECLSKKITVSKVKYETLYEPISPAGYSEDDD